MLDFLVLAAGSLLQVLALPNELVSDGWAFLGPWALVPVFWFTLRRGPGPAALAGALWITLVTLLSQFWLFSFHPLAILLVLAWQVPAYAGVFALSSWGARKAGALNPWVQACLWTAFEWLRIQGFLAYPYGAVASTLWSAPLLWQTADLVGTSGLTFLLAWTSAWTAGWVSRSVPWARARLDLAAGLVLWTLDWGYGLVRWNEPLGTETRRVSLIQQAKDPWEDWGSAYGAALERLESLSRQALTEDPDLVVWSETAVVPSVFYHLRYRENPESLGLVRNLETFLGATPVPFLVGNAHREKAADGTLENYNTVLAWTGSWSGRYEKTRLVPFTEAFPWKKELPWVYQWLKDADTHFWETGRQTAPLAVAGTLVGTPICYEDLFPDISASLTRQGARLLANLTDDSWSAGKAARYQHLALAVFRTVETRTPLVRAANDGATVAVSSRGEVTARLEVGPPGHLTAEVALGTGKASFYSQFGDWFPVACALTFLGCLVGLPARRRPVVDKGQQL